jgi:ABC-type antimicrobial peptide transport system permease subunit
VRRSDRSSCARALGIAILGVFIGVGIALVGARAITALLYGVSGNDPWIVVGASLTIVAVSLLACYLPPRRATQIDAIVALREF